MDESQFVANESENVDDMCIKEHTSRSPTPSETSIHDDEYRPSPPPPPTVHSPSPEVSPDTAVELPPEEIASRAMARPIFWTSVLDTWTTLGSNQWLEATVADFYLTHVWYEMSDRFSMRYVDLHTSMANDISEEELVFFRRNYFFPREGTCPVVPVGFLVHYSQHFFVAIFDYQRRNVYVLGRHISVESLQVDGIDPHNWCDWNGPEYWRRIAFLHGWSTGDDTDVSIITRDWLQNGLDCGPIACSMLEQCFNSGLDRDGNLLDLDVQCGHLLRIKMLRILAGRVKLSCSDYLMLLDKPQASWQEGDMPDEDIISMIQNGRHQAQCLKLLRTLIVLSSTCSICQRRTPKQEFTLSSYTSLEGVDETTFDQPELDISPSHDDEEDEEDVLGSALPADRKARLAVLFKKNKQLAGSRSRNSIIARAVGTHLQLEPVEAPPGQDTINSQRSEPATATRRRVKNWNLGSYRRFPRPIAPLPLAAYTGSRWLKDDHTFDDYEGGPTIEMLLAPRDILPTMTFQAGGLPVSTAWVDWIDHGYRITPGSFHIFYQCDPVATMEHIMPIGTTDSHDPSNQVPDRVTGNYSLERRGSGSHVEGHQTSVTDVEIFSAAELIDSANYDPPLHDECRFGRNAFVKGCASHRFGDGPALYLDLERDAVKFSEQEIATSVDIDSIIWTTKEFRCRGS
ncbi:hypothetical protein CY34DRAFT_111164, partial [Suillus luteus UH-Slu-Lm8-n1]